jgi:hypothetical protein
MTQAAPPKNPFLTLSRLLSTSRDRRQIPLLNLKCQRLRLHLAQAQAVSSRTLSVLGSSRAEVYAYKTMTTMKLLLISRPYLSTHLSSLSAVSVLHTT